MKNMNPNSTENPETFRFFKRTRRKLVLNFSALIVSDVVLVSHFTKRGNMSDELAAVLYGKGDIRLEQRRPADPRKDEVLVRVDCVGICGSDVHQWLHGGIGDKRIESPMVMGHEGAGTVER